MHSPDQLEQLRHAKATKASASDFQHLSAWPGKQTEGVELKWNGGWKKCLESKDASQLKSRFAILIFMDPTMPKSTSKRGVFPSACK